MPERVCGYYCADLGLEFKQPKSKPPITFAWGDSSLAELFALEVRRPLVQEGIHPLTKILAHVSLEDEVFALLARQGPADAAHRLLGDFEGDRRMGGDQLCRLVGAALQGRHVRHHLVEEPERERLGRLD